MCSKCMMHQSWVNDKVYDNNLANLESMNLREFTSKFTVSMKGDQRNKLYCNKKNNFITIFYLKSFIPTSNKYLDFCKYLLNKIKPLISNKDSV